MNKGEAQHMGYSRSGSASKHAVNIVLVGRTGNGKSATANSLIGERVFESKAQATYVTKECQIHETVTKDGHNIKVIDTPAGLFDLSASAIYISKQIVRCLNLAEGGIHAVLLVLSARTPITEEEENTLSTLQALFGSQILDYVIVVFTGGDVLEDNDETLDGFLGSDCPPFIKEVISMCGNRKIVIDNKTHDEGKKAEQVHRLLSIVDEIRRSNGGEAYTNDIYHEIKDEIDRLRKQYEELESKNHSEEMVETKLRETTKRLEQQVGEEQAARLEAEKRANEVQRHSSEEIKMLRENLERAEKETKELKKKLGNCIKLWVLFTFIYVFFRFGF